MLQDKLDQAARKATKTRLMVFMILGAVGVAVGLGIFYLNQSSFIANLTANPRPDGGGAITEPPAVASITAELSTMTESWEGNVSPKPSVSQTDTMPSPPPISGELTPPDTEDREAFKDLLKRLEEGPEPVITSDTYGAWRPEAQRDVAFLKNEGYKSFAATDYTQALSKMQKALGMAEEEAQAFEQAYQTALAAARAAKQADDYQAASATIAEALALVPAAEEALILKSLIDVMPQVQRLLKSADGSRVENNVQAEHESLKKVVSLDPSRSDVADRVAKLSTQIAEDDYSKHISAGFKHVEQRRLNEALAQLAHAHKTFPNRAETKLLGGKVAALKSDLETEQHIADAETAAEVDEWQRSLQSYTKAQAIQPNNQTAVVGAALARSITQLSGKVSQNLQNEHRLASKNAADAARGLLKTAAALVGTSPSLDRQASELAAKLDAYAIDVAVVVTSDEKTKVSVRGVGQVGVIAQKTIKLKPGIYTFEGKRAGFKSKLVRVNIPPGTKELQVTVVSDERI